MMTPHPFFLLLLSFVAAHSVVGQDGETKVNSGIRPRNVAPSFKAKSVIDDKFREISLTEYTSRGQWVVLVNWTYLAYMARFLALTSNQSLHSTDPNFN